MDTTHCIEHGTPATLVESVTLQGDGKLMQTTERYDVIVVGSGHAGCEAALAAARAGCRTAIFTLNLDSVALMPCNPSIGGPGKAHLAREVDALGGEMARTTDRTSIQIRMLNTSKGPAVQALRAQCDKHAYSQAMKFVLEAEPNLDVKQVAVEDLLLVQMAGAPSVGGIITSSGAAYESAAVVLTTGTFLKGRIITGDHSSPGGRAGEFPADALSASLARVGFTLGRLKTGTPPRIDGRSIDYSLTTLQPGSETPLFFSYDARNAFREGRMSAPNHYMPVAHLGGPTLGGDDMWREQMPCFLVQTNEETHNVIRENLARAPMYNGGITSAGPRYCPSIETKIVRFAEKPSHQLFLEPEGWQTREMYVAGANTSLPEDVQLAMLRTVPALKYCEIMRPGYAIEYDYLPATQVRPSLESKALPGLFLAGQIIGTTGYEEAAALGIMAGINAARAVQSREALILRRDEAYIGVLIDDLVTKIMDEPYRMHTSQAEFRLLLRQDNADQRLAGHAYASGLIDETRHAEVKRRESQIREVLSSLETVWLGPNERVNRTLERFGCQPLTKSTRASDLLCHSDVTVEVLQELDAAPVELIDEVAREVQTVVRYAGYVSRQDMEVQRLRKQEDRTIPLDFDYASAHGLRSESRERLAVVQPRTVGQASRVAGVAPSDISILLVHLERYRTAAVS